jgi:hypothetical protein
MKPKLIKKSEWQSWPIAAEPTFTTAMVRRDPLTGMAWKWVKGGKRVEIAREPKHDQE